jgi:hypothetical protein
MTPHGGVLQGMPSGEVASTRHGERRALLLSEIVAGRRRQAFRLGARNQFDDMHGAAGASVRPSTR